MKNLSDDFRNIQSNNYTLIDDFTDEIRVNLTGCGVFETETAEVGSFILPEFLAVYYRSGAVKLSHRDKTIQLSPGSFYIFKPYEVYSGIRTSSCRIVFSYMLFDISTFLNDFDFGFNTFFPDDGIFGRPCYQKLGQLMDAHSGSSPASRCNKAVMKQLARLAAVQIATDQADITGSHGFLASDRDSRLIVRAFRCVSEHLSEPVSINSIAEVTATSKTTLERAFKNVLGLTPKQAVTRFKLERSMELLKQGIPIKMIVKELGFSSVYHFSNTFKAVTGIRPSAYRQLGSGGLAPVPDDGERDGV